MSNKPRIVCKRRALPTRWGNKPGLVLETNLRICSSRLRAKLVVFDRPKSLRAYWRRVLGHDLGKKCLAAVNKLQEHRERVGKDGKVINRRIVVDRRYFCVIGLCVGYLNMRVISHESVHAGFAYASRRTRAWWDELALAYDEEWVAYPAGEVAAAIVTKLSSAKLLKEYDSE